MLKDITLGQYYPVNSIIHRLDPRVKLMGTLIYVISLFCFKGILGIAIITAFLAACIILSRVPLKFMLKGLRSIVFIVLFAGALNVFLSSGEVIWSYGVLKITKEGLVIAGLMTFRMVYLIVGCSIMTLTTTPNELTAGLEKSLGIFSKIGIPVHEIAMMMSIALRFIPILTDETDKIMRAQKARGADFENGNIIKRIKAMIPLLVPLFVSAFRRANDLALAMEARCYNGGKGRTKMRPLKYASRDFVGYVILLIYLAAVILTKVLPGGGAA